VLFFVRTNSQVAAAVKWWVDTSGEYIRAAEAGRAMAAIDQGIGV